MKLMLGIFCWIAALMTTHKPLFSMYNSHYTTYELLWGQQAAHMIGYGGDINALKGLVRLCSSDRHSLVIGDAMLGLHCGAFNELYSLFKDYFKGYLTEENLIKSLDVLNDSYLYYYKRAYGEKAAYNIGFFGIPEALIELLRKCEGNFDSTMFREALLGLHAGQHTQLFSYLERYVQKQITLEELILEIQGVAFDESSESDLELN